MKNAPKWNLENDGSEREPSVKAPARKRPSLVWMDTVEAREVNWLWKPYIPYGELTVIDGDPGVGKSWLTCAIAAALSSGVPLPEQTALPPQNVLMLNVEDNPHTTLRPRLEALGADLRRVAIPNEPWTLDPQGIKDLYGLMQKVSATFVVIDPITSWMGGKVDINKANEVLTLMSPLAQAAERTGSAVILVRHMRKGGDGEKSIYRGLGSIATIGSARSGLTVSEGEGDTAIIRHVKSNVGPKGPPIAYSRAGGVFHWLGVFEEPENVDAASGRPTVSTRPRQFDKAVAFLKDVLKYGPVPASEVFARAKDEGLTEVTLKRAKVGVVETAKIGGGAWEWSLINAPTLEEAPHPMEVALQSDQTTEAEGPLARMLAEARARSTFIQRTKSNG